MWDSFVGFIFWDVAGFWNGMSVALEGRAKEDDEWCGLSEIFPRRLKLLREYLKGQHDFFTHPKAAPA
jgi:hypothetical protein